MLLAFRALLLIVCVAVCAPAQTRTLALYVEPAPGLDSIANRTMRAELQRLLAPAGLQIVWRNLSERNAGESFELVAVSSFAGSCAAGSAPANTIPTTASLADTSIANGHILPFFRVTCARVIQMLGSHAQPSAVGRALGRVMAHEIYHIVGQTKDHQDSGVAKAALSHDDLTTPRFELDPWSLARMRPIANVSANLH